MLYFEWHLTFKMLIKFALNISLFILNLKETKIAKKPQRNCKETAKRPQRNYKEVSQKQTKMPQKCHAKMASKEAIDMLQTCHKEASKIQ